jgi:hypothetical protein
LRSNAEGEAGAGGEMKNEQKLRKMKQLQTRKAGGFAEAKTSRDSRSERRRRE